MRGMMPVPLASPIFETAPIPQASPIFGTAPGPWAVGATPVRRVPTWRRIGRPPPRPGTAARWRLGLPRSLRLPPLRLPSRLATQVRRVPVLGPLYRRPFRDSAARDACRASAAPGGSRPRRRVAGFSTMSRRQRSPPVLQRLSPFRGLPSQPKPEATVFSASLGRVGGPLAGACLAGMPGPSLHGRMHGVPRRRPPDPGKPQSDVRWV